MTRRISAPAGPADATGRSVEIWVGRNPDAAIPPRVKLRILRRQDFRCAYSGREFVEGDKIEFDHVTALCNGGRHAEDNLVAVLAVEHKVKTRADVRLKAKADRIQKKRFGLENKRSGFATARSGPFKRTIGGQVVRRNETD